MVVLTLCELQLPLKASPIFSFGKISRQNFFNVYSSNMAATRTGSISAIRQVQHSWSYSFQKDENQLWTKQQANTSMEKVPTYTFS